MKTGGLHNGGKFLQLFLEVPLFIYMSLSSFLHMPVLLFDLLERILFDTLQRTHTSTYTSTISADTATSAAMQKHKQGRDSFTRPLDTFTDHRQRQSCSPKTHGLYAWKTTRWSLRCSSLWGRFYYSPHENHYCFASNIINKPLPLSMDNN